MSAKPMTQQEHQEDIYRWEAKIRSTWVQRKCDHCKKRLKGPKDTDFYCSRECRNEATGEDFPF
jgi:hypothetical protein